MYITSKLIESIENKIPVVFTKYGDGEYNCANSIVGHNCDSDNYTLQKGQHLIDSFRYFVKDISNMYIGIWHTRKMANFWETLIPDRTVPWVNYHSVIIDDSDVMHKSSLLYEKIKLYETVQTSGIKKLLFVMNYCKKQNYY